MSRFEDDTNVGIAFIYCNFKLQHKDDDMLISLLKQLSEQQQALPDCVKELFKRHKTKHTRPSSEEIFGNLQSVAAMYSEVFVIVDALDECQVTDGSRKGLLTNIFKVKKTSSVSLLATSRSIPDIMDIFKGDTQLEVRATQEDLSRYLQAQESLLPSCVSRNSQLREEVKAAILKAVDGMYVAIDIADVRSL